MVDIKAYLDNMTPEQFEKICIELLRFLKPSSYKIIGTRYVKDGGKDIIGTVENVPYEIWAECKKHTRPIGLEEISKNVILVISKEINELFFFSTSKITANARKHISIVSAKHGLKIAFYDDEILIEALSKLPQFSKDTLQNKKCDELAVSVCLSKYENPDSYDFPQNLILDRDCFFYINLFLKNRASKEFSNIHFTWNPSPHIKMNIKEIDNDINLSPCNDRAIQIRCELLDCKNKHKIPDIKIKYVSGNKALCETLRMGIVDPTSLVYLPLIGEKPNFFLINKVKPIFSLPQSTNSNLINIFGESGNGKSRLLKEIVNIAADNDRTIIQFDARKNNDYIIVKELICTLLSIPYNKGNLAFSAENIANILAKRNADSSFAKSIYNFVFENEISESNTYFVKQAILNFLITPIFNEQYVLVFDNVQNLSIAMIDMLTFVIDNLYQRQSNCTIVLSINTEIVPAQNQERINNFFEFLDSLADDYYIPYHCDVMDKKDAKSLYIHSLNNAHTDFIDILVKKSGYRPFDVIMLVKYLQDKKIIYKNQYTWYIKDFKKIDQLISAIPPKTHGMIKERIKLQKENHNEQYWKEFKTVIKSLVYFKNFVPLAFLSYINISEETISEMNNSLFVKYDDVFPAITFFHDNFFRFFEIEKAYSFDADLANKINFWVANNQSLEVPHREVILYNTYIDVGNYEQAKDFGILTIKGAYNNCNYAVSSEIGSQLIKKPLIKLSKQEHFEILYIVANSNREKINHEEGATLFLQAYDYLNKHKDLIYISADEYNKFMHSCVNSQINADSPNTAIKILDNFILSPTLNDYYKFIVYNRYAVAELATGNIENAYNHLLIAENLALQMDSKMYKSIIYSDMAFFHLNAYEDKEKVIHYFKKAYITEADCGNDINRWAEILQQNALRLLLEGQYTMALDEVNKSIEKSQQIGNTFLTIKAMTLKGVIHVYLEDFENALKIMNTALSLCEKYKSIVGKIKLYTNFSALYIANGECEKAKEYSKISFELFKETTFSSVKHKPLFYNYITANSNDYSYEGLLNLLSEFVDENILSRIEDVKYNHVSFNEIPSHGVIKFKNGVFNY